MCRRWRSYIDHSITNGTFNQNFIACSQVWVINYTMLFVAALGFINIKWLRSMLLAQVNIFLDVLALILFLIPCIISLFFLKDNFLRYFSYAIAAMLIFSMFRYTKQEFARSKSINYTSAFEILLALCILVVISNELITWMDIIKIPQSNKLGLSILWGIYSLVLIILGIWKRKQHLRFAAIVLFGITLIKLFFYDLLYLDTIAKTIVFVSLGLLLLVISFLYNKYKNRMLP